MVNTLVLAVYERTRELGMLRAVGMTRRQARRMIRHESVITALIGAAMGIPLGIFLAALDHPGAVEVRRRPLAAGDRAGRVHRGGDRRGRARGDHPRPPRVAHRRAGGAAVRVGERSAGRAMRRRPAFPARYGVVVLRREGQRLAVRARAQRVVGVDQLAELQRRPRRWRPGRCRSAGSAARRWSRRCCRRCRCWRRCGRGPAAAAAGRTCR